MAISQTYHYIIIYNIYNPYTDVCTICFVFDQQSPAEVSAVSASEKLSARGSMPCLASGVTFVDAVVGGRARLSAPSPPPATLRANRRRRSAATSAC